MGDRRPLMYNRHIMMDWKASFTAPLVKSDDGVIRISGTRVSLDSVIHHFKQGATAEELACKFPALYLADVYAVIAYYLHNREEVEDYLQQQDADADAMQRRIESPPEYQADRAALRERLLARWSAQP